MKVLVTTTSYQDTPGPHHQQLESQGYELVRARGPLPEAEIRKLVGDVDGIICGDDDYTPKVLKKAAPTLKVLSKYGIGLDRIDVEAATKLKIPVCFTPGVNHTTVAEHAFGLMISMLRNIPRECSLVKEGQWTRITGHELLDKTIGILGLGRIGKEVAKRSVAFGMKVVAFTPNWDEEFLRECPVQKTDDPVDVLRVCDILSLHMRLTDQTRRFLNRDRIEFMKEGAFVVNTSRGGLIETDALIEALSSGKIAGYATDVLDREPPDENDPLLNLDSVIVTPHIGSRTYENVIRQATMATENLIRVLSGQPAIAQANKID
jgi:D-3-phosphoglycerate dehydrogenase